MTLTKKTTASTTSPPGRSRFRSTWTPIGLRTPVRLARRWPTRRCPRRPRPREPPARICSWMIGPARRAFLSRIQRNPASLSERIAALAPALGVAVVPVQTAFPDSAEIGIGSDDVGALHAPRILVAAGDGISETSYGWLWYFLARELNVPFTPVPLRAIGRMSDLQSFNVFIVPDGSGGRMRRELGDDGVERLKTWVRSGGVLIAYGGAG